MGIEKTYEEFMILNEKRVWAKVIKSLEISINELKENNAVNLGFFEKDIIDKITGNITQEIQNLKKLLNGQTK